MGLPTHNSNATDFVPPDIGNRTFVDAFFRLLDGQAGGRNYWWPDNGYGTELSKQHGLNRVLWDRHMFYEHVNETTCGRPSVFVRLMPRIIDKWFQAPALTSRISMFGCTNLSQSFHLVGLAVAECLSDIPETLSHHGRRCNSYPIVRTRTVMTDPSLPRLALRNDFVSLQILRPHPMCSTRISRTMLRGTATTGTATTQNFTLARCNTPLFLRSFVPTLQRPWVW